MKRSEPVINDSFWRYITNAWCLVCYGAIIYDFITNHSIGNTLYSILVIYVALLVIFVGAKEFERWFEIHTSRHPGEIFVIGWTVLMIGLVIAKLMLHTEYQIPDEVISTYIAVLSIMAITQKSKKMRVNKRISKKS